MPKLSLITATIAASLIAITLTATLSTEFTPTQNVKKINIKWPTYKDFHELANSAKLILYGRVKSIKSTGNSSYPYTVFEITSLRFSKLAHDLTPITAMVSQYGQEIKGLTVEAEGDPLMKIGEEYVFFLVGGEGTGFFVPYNASGPYGRFQVVSGMIQPVSPSWLSYKGMTVDQFFDEIDNTLGIQSTYSTLWDSNPEITNGTWDYNTPFLPESKYPAPVWLLETWIGKIGMHLEELRSKGVIIYSCGYSGDGKVHVGMEAVSELNVSILLETIRGEVPPGILVISKDYPVIPL